MARLNAPPKPMQLASSAAAGEPGACVYKR
jgi:hypothetical protein